MKNRSDLNRIFMLLLLLAVFNISNAQSNSKQNYRWQKKSHYELSSSEQQSYKDLPEIDYAPDQNINEWSNAKALKDFATAQTANRITVRSVLKIDETGIIRSVKILSSNNTGAADALSKLLVNARVSGPAYIHNKAVTAYVPCFFLITNKQISTL